MREHRSREEKPLLWVGSAKKDLLGFPEQVMDDVGFALGVVQYGGHPPSATRLSDAMRDYEERYGKETD